MKPDGYQRIGRDIPVETAKRGCLDKRRYVNKTAARDQAVKIAKQSGDPVPMRPYRCGLCSGWHLTSAQPHGLSQRPTEAIGKGMYVAPQFGKKPKAA